MNFFRTTDTTDTTDTTIWKPGFTQPRRRLQQERHKFAHLIEKNNSFARFARAVFIFDISLLVLSATWNDLFCSCVDDATIWWQIVNIVLLSMKRWFQFNSRIVTTHFASIMTLNNWEMITETWSYIFRWRSRCCRRRVCVNSLLSRVIDFVLFYIIHFASGKYQLRRNWHYRSTFRLSE